MPGISQPRIPWSDHRRRVVCRTAFIGLVVVPTLATLWTASRSTSPADAVAGFVAATGCLVTAESVETPRPGEMTLRQVTVGSGRDWGIDIPSVAVAGTGPVRAVIEDSIWVPAAQLGQLLARVVASGNHAAGESAGPGFHLRCERLVLTGPAGAGPAPRLIVAPLELAVIRAPASSSIVIRFAVPGSGNGEPVELGIELQEGGETIRLDSGTNVLPGWLLAAFVPDLELLGPEAAWSGIAWMRRSTGHAWQGQISGLVERVDVSGALRQAAPCPTGQGRIRLDELAISDGRLARLRGQVWIERGTIDPRTAQLLGQFGWQVGGGPQAGPSGASSGAGGVLPFQHFLFRVEFGGGQLRVEPLPEYTAADGSRWVAWSDQGQVIVSAGPQSLPRRLNDLAGLLFSPAGAEGAGSVLNNEAVAFLSRFQMEAAAESPADSVERLASQPLPPTQHR